MRHRSRTWVVMALLCLMSVAPTGVVPADEVPGTPEAGQLLEDLTKKVDVTWNAWIGKKPWLEVMIVLQGKAATLASGCGDVTIDELIDENGNPVEVDDDSLEIDTADIAELRDDKKAFGGGTGLVLRVPDAVKLKTIKTLRGTLAIETGGTEQIVVVKRPFASLDGIIDSDDLADLGVSLALGRTRRKPGTWSLRGYFADEIKVNGRWTAHPCEEAAAGGEASAHVPCKRPEGSSPSGLQEH